MTTTNTKLEDIILRAVDIVASQKIAKAGYDKTIQATIISCVDETIGKYKVKYQDSYWIAYSNNIDNYYAPNTSVYVLIPGGNMSKDKTILGTTKRLGINYITIAEGDEKYAPIGTNVINNDTVFNLCSYKTETKVLYSSDFTNEQNLLIIDDDAIKEYIKNSTSIIAGAHIKNNLNTQQRFQGNYGILFGLDFIDSATRKTVTRYYSIDVDSMNGNPYYYPNEIRQYGVFDIDGANFEKVNMIAIFTKDFPVQDEEMPDDIFISNIELCGATSLSTQDLDSCALVLLTPKGYIFTKDSASNETRNIQAQIRVKGKIIDPKSQNVDFYWFIENLSVTAADPKYNKYGGQGWQCLNNYQTIKTETVNGSDISPAILQFIPGSNIFSVKKSDVLAETTKYKCVAIYDNTVLSKEVKIIRYDSTYDIQISSSAGTQFYNNVGTTTLTCACRQKNNDDSTSIVNPDDLNFVWAVINNAGNFNSLPTTVEYNEDRLKLIAIRDAINEYIDAEYLLHQTIYNVNSLLPSDTTINNITNTTQKTKVTNAKELLINAGLTTSSNITTILNEYNVQTSNLTYELVLNGDENNTNSLKTAIDNYNGIQRVSGNQVTGIQINNITDFSIFKCSVFTKIGNTFLGSGSITLSNLLDGNRYSLVINNGTQVYKYNTHGVSPASRQNVEPQVIPALTFSIYDNLGNEIESDVIDNTNITWTIPNNDTLLRTNYTGGIVDSTLQTISYKNLTSFAYSIAENYNVNHTRNNIELKVQYNGLVLVTRTNLSFLKQGENSTNGTDFVCKIVPNTISGDIPLNPTIYYDGIRVAFNWTTDTTNNKWFKAQLWHNGTEPIFESTDSGNSTEGKFVTIIKWEVLKNVYAYNKQDSTNLSAVAATSNGNWSFNFLPEFFSSAYSSSAYSEWRPANIIKVTLSYDGMTYYATLPIIVCRIFNSNYLVQLKDYSGFREVLYNSSGESPRYDSHAPFEITTLYKVGNNWEDISTKTTSTYKLGYEWYYLGSIWNKNSNGTWTEDAETTSSASQSGDSSKKWLLKSNVIKTTQPNQKAIKPADHYNGECVNTALACRVYLDNSGTTLAWIHIPIHMMRNRFENSAINGWDGNSVNLGGENGGMILAPQVGAGIKDSNNRFTGVFIGTAKDPQEELSSSKNNTSNSAQGRFASTNEDVGLFGYNEGSISIFLDAKTGKAVFGQKNQAQIILDPTQTNSAGRKVAQIRSGNYDTTNGTGLLIDLSTPEIKYGSEDFQVDENGHMTARGGGQIAGWGINDTAIFNKLTSSGIRRNLTGMNSNPIVDSTSTSINGVGNGSEYREVRIPVYSQNRSNSNDIILEDDSSINNNSNTRNFFSLNTASINNNSSMLRSGDDELVDEDPLDPDPGSGSGSGGSGSSDSDPIDELLPDEPIPDNPVDPNPGSSTDNPVISGDGYQIVGKAAAFWAGGSNFFVTHDGYLRAQQASIGSGSEPIYIGRSNASTNYSAIFSGKKSAKNVSANGFYLGTDGIAIGSTSDITVNNTTETISNFQVNSDGTLYARRGYIGNGRQGWEIGSNFLKNGKTSYNDTTYNGVYLGTDGIGLGKGKFYVNNAGDLHSISGQIANWKISTNSIRSTNDATYGGTTGMYFGQNGLRLGENFHVSSNGTLYAKSGIIDTNVTVKGTVSAANIVTGTINEKSVSWQDVDVINGITVSSQQRTWMSNLHRNGSYLAWTDHTGYSINYIYWTSSTLKLLVGKTSKPSGSSGGSSSSVIIDDI